MTPDQIKEEALRLAEGVKQDYLARQSDIVAPIVLRKFGEYLLAEAAPYIKSDRRGDQYWEGVAWAGRRAIEYAEEMTISTPS